MGALTFAFVDPDEARRWVSEYYTTFKQECEPIGCAVNPNVAMVTGFMCHEDSQTAVDRGLEGFQFFGYALSHYYFTGTHIPGRFDIWQDFQQNRPARREPTGGIGSPDQVREQLRTFEEAGVDQVIFIQQAGNNRHEHITESLELFADRVLPEFQDRHGSLAQRRAEKLAPFIAQAHARIQPPPTSGRIRPVDAYPVLMQKQKGEPVDKGSDHPILSSLGMSRKKDP
jgi:hypothetical protein